MKGELALPVCSVVFSILIKSTADAHKTFFPEQTVGDIADFEALLVIQCILSLAPG